MALPRFKKENPIIVRASAGESSLENSVRQDGAWSRIQIVNRSAEPVAVEEVVIATFGPFAPSNRIYGEGFQMLSQYTGVVAGSSCLTPHSDRDHYRLPQVSGSQTFYNLLHVEIANDDHLLLAFSSSFRFGGEFRLHSDGTCDVLLNCEGRKILPDEKWDMEEFGSLQGVDANLLFDQLAARIAQNHPPRDLSSLPTGWCSWYCFGPELTEEHIDENLAAIRESKVPLTYIQIDDGFQSHMGDWTNWAPGFPNGLAPLVARIKEAGLEPAIWLAPFIAEQDSEILRLHPTWFVADEAGAPLASDRVTFGGWRSGPWYCLDGSHPEVQDHLEKLSQYFRDTFDCRYFKLDALFWGAPHGGRFFDPQATRIEAYRRGMEAFNRGAGQDSYILGCNAPLWPSLGLVNGMRVTSDICRSWESIQCLAQEQFFRNWQHGRLWINDPDCICLDEGEKTFPKPGDLRSHEKTPATLAEFRFHAAVILASGGAKLSGDDLPSLTPEKMRLLSDLIAAPQIAAQFRPFDFTVGYFCDSEGHPWRVFFNPQNTEQVVEVENPASGVWRALWQDTDSPITSNGASAGCSLVTVPARSATVLHAV